MNLAPTRQGADWRMQDLAWAGLLSLAILVPLTSLAMPYLSASRWHQVTLGVSLEACAFIPAVILAAKRRGAGPADLGLGRYPWRKALFLGCCGGTAAFLLVQACGSLLAAMGARVPEQRLLAETLLMRRQSGNLLLFLGIAGVVAPVWEELFFRGLGYSVLRRRLGAAAASFLSALLFALLHAEPLLLRLPIFLLGIFLAFLFQWSGSLYVPIAAHGVANILSTMLAYLGH